ncbi:MAG: heme o synthase [Alphaproteobacteria bacterium]|nr:heme o synthase [Alphaproteobacteria bacterium]
MTALAIPDYQNGSASDYFQLLKPRVMSLVVFTGLAGMVIAPGGFLGGLHPVLAFTALLCIAVGSGAAGAINMWYDRDIDAKMERTKARPLPAGRMEAGEVLGFGITLSVFSVIIMGLAVNLLAAALLAAAILFYVFVYTIGLKRRTPQNIVIGGAAGAFPPVIGWAAATGSIGLAPIILFSLIFLWTPPHFWALALFRSDEYKRAGVPMLPVVAGVLSTKRHILVYSILLVALSFAPVMLGFAGRFYGAVALGLGAIFILGAARLWASADEVKGLAYAKSLFAYSILYLFVIMTAIMIDHV